MEAPYPADYRKCTSCCLLLILVRDWKPPALELGTLKFESETFIPGVKMTGKIPKERHTVPADLMVLMR